MSHRILAVNPGGGSTRVAAYDGHDRLFSAELRHDQATLEAATELPDQLALRLAPLRTLLLERGVDLASFDAVVGRGGPYRPLPGGVYQVNRSLLEDIAAGRIMADHPSKLGALMADLLAREAALPAMVVDPVSVDELDPVARITGLPELPRRSLFHALNIKAVARRFAVAQGRPLAELSLIVAHLGSGVSVAWLRGGRAVDVNNSADEGPFSVRRAGGLPATGLLALATQPGFELEATRDRLMAGGGMLAHLGTADLALAEARAASGDEHAERVLEAMAYGVAKAIGAQAAAASGRVDAILLTGGMAHSEPWLARLEPRVAWIAPVHRFPGEGEMRALAEGALAVLQGLEPLRRYPDGVCLG
jgi:butyrate kinase